jgi:hypothetical protein
MTCLPEASSHDGKSWISAASPTPVNGDGRRMGQHAVSSLVAAGLVVGQARPPWVQRNWMNRLTYATVA